jgi:hypothetical protein
MTARCFQKIKSSLQIRIYQDIEDIKKCEDGTKSYFITVVSKMFPTVAAAKGEYFEVICEYTGVKLITHKLHEKK